MMPGSIISGNCKIGNNTLIGSGAKIHQGLKIGKNCKIGMGTLITNEVKENKIIVDYPRKITKDIK